MPASGHIALAGAPNAGKSSLLNAIVGQHLAIVSPKAQSTRLPAIGLRTEGDVQFIFHDLPGLFDPSYLLQVRMRGAALDALRRMDLVLHLHPAPEAPAPPFEHLTGPTPQVRVPLVVVYTKSDLVSPARREELETGAAVVSATQGWGIESLLGRIRAYLPEREFQYDSDDVGTQPLRFFVVEYLREAAFQVLGDELPYAFTAEVEEFREAERPVYIRVTLYVERESQKGMVIGQAGRTIKAIGAHARARMEALMDMPVYLDCWVKVLPNWRKSSAALSRFGFVELPAGEPVSEPPRKENA
jgi:GTP-binding protein Era